MLTFVTAFYPTRTDVDFASYWADFARLVSTGVPILLFLDPAHPPVDLPPNVRVLHRPLQPIVPEGLELRLPTHRNPTKDTQDFLRLMLHKLWFMTEAGKETETPYLAWIDFRIFHIVHSVARVQAALRALTQHPPQTPKILAPGCWSQETSVDRLNQICWRYCGGFLLGPRDSFPLAYARQSDLVSRWLPHLTWEVNYWSCMEDVFAWYAADHNDTMILNVPGSASTTASSEA